MAEAAVLLASGDSRITHACWGLVSLCHVKVPLVLRLALVLALGLFGVHVFAEEVLFNLPSAVARMRRELERWELTFIDGTSLGALAQDPGADAQRAHICPLEGCLVLFRR